MSFENIERRFSQPEDPVINAMHEMQHSQDELIEAALAWKNLPTAKRYSDIFIQLEETQDSIVKNLKPVFETELSESETYEDKQIVAATLIVNMRDDRREVFNRQFAQSVKGLLQPTPLELVRGIQEELEEEIYYDEDDVEEVEDYSTLSVADPGDVIGRLTSIYAQDFSEEISQIIPIVNTSTRSRIFDGVHTLGHHALDIGKTSASLIIAGAILGRYLRK